jgi:hypothetical protein
MPSVKTKPKHAKETVQIKSAILSFSTKRYQDQPHQTIGKIPTQKKKNSY